jgi:hypothetical protein
MSDLEQRLRGFYTTGINGARDFSPYVPPIAIEAADRIAELESELAAEREKVITDAFMAGQCDCGVDPSWSSAQAYFLSLTDKGE